MKHFYVISARDVKKGEFETEPGRLRYLKVPDGKLSRPMNEVGAKEWIEEVRDVADGQLDGAVSEGGNALIFVHGHNYDVEFITKRQVRLAQGASSHQGGP